MEAEDLGLSKHASASLELLRRQYLQLMSPDLLTVPSPNVMVDARIQKFLYDDILKVDAFRPPPERYRLRVLKLFIAQIEEGIQDPDQDEVSDDLMQCLAEMMASPPPSESTAAQQKDYVTYTLPCELEASVRKHFTLTESRALISSSGTTGLRTWEGSLHLAHFLITEEGRKFVEGKVVLELGAGTGVISLLCARFLRSSRVMATDGVAGVVESMKENFQTSGLKIPEEVGCEPLRWGWKLKGSMFDDSNEANCIDTVLGADITYDISVVPSLVATLRDLFDRYPHLQIIICATIRNAETFQTFLSACDANRFDYFDVHYDAPPYPEQTGLFFSTASAIRIVCITRSGRGQDPFSLILRH